MAYKITHRSRDGYERVVHEDKSLDNSVGYMCAITTAEANRRNVHHSMTHPSFRTKSFSASAPDGGMYRLERA
jgi:hypothetical protein